MVIQSIQTYEIKILSLFNDCAALAYITRMSTFTFNVQCTRNLKSYLSVSIFLSQNLNPI